jgi:CRP-like cAMP-binding protein
LFDIINEKYKETTDRVKILEKKQIRDILLEYFEIEHKKTHSRYIYLPFNFKDLADYLAINRSAMFRELKNLKEEKFIEVKDRRITLLYKIH